MSLVVKCRLTAGQQTRARQVWDELRFPSFATALMGAREALLKAPNEVRSANIEAQIDMWRQGNESSSDDPNPFG